MTTVYSPKGVCAKRMEIETEDGIIKSVKVQGGCHGNLQGIARLVVDMPVEEAARRLRGVRCGMKSTSCPDQLAIALEGILNSSEN